MTSPASVFRRPAVLVGVLVLTGSFLLFWSQTMPVRFSNNDDVTFDAAAHSAAPAEFSAHYAGEQARFFFALPGYQYIFLAPYRIGSAARFSLLRAVLFFGQAALVGALAARLLNDTEAGLATTLAITTTLHLPETYFPVLSFPPLSIGCLLLLAALHCHLTAIRTGAPLPQIAAALCFLLACLCHDIFLVLAPAFVGLSLAVRGPRWREVIRDNAGPFIAGACYLAVYLAFVREFPSQYEGTQPSLDLLSAGKVLLRQIGGVMPGFELFYNRTGPIGAPAIRSLSALSSDFGHPLALAVGLAQGATLAWLVVRCAQRGSPAGRLWPGLVGLAFWVNFPIAFSAKYQVFIFHREFPYVYAFYSFCLLSWATVAATIWLANRAPRRRRPWLIVAAVLAVLAPVSAQVSNRRTLLELAAARPSPPSPR